MVQHRGAMSRIARIEAGPANVPLEATYLMATVRAGACNAISIAQMDENNTPKIAAAVYPSH